MLLRQNHLLPELHHVEEQILPGQRVQFELQDADIAISFQSPLLCHLFLIIYFLTLRYDIIVWNPLSR